jgi:hypothetical protein
MIRTNSHVEYEKRLPKPKPFTIKGNHADVIREELRDRERIPITDLDLQERMSAEEY